VGVRAIIQTAEEQGETFASQLLLGIERNKRVGFDRFSTLMKGSVIGFSDTVSGTREVTSDILLAGDAFSARVIKSLHAAGVIDENTMELTALGKTLGSADEIQGVLSSIKKLNETAATIQNVQKFNRTSAFVEYRQQLLESFGLEKYGAMIEDTGKMQELIKEAIKRGRARETEAVVKFAEDAFGAISLKGSEEIKAYIDDLSKQNVMIRGQEISIQDLLVPQQQKRDLLDQLERKAGASLNSMKESNTVKEINDLTGINYFPDEGKVKITTAFEYQTAMDTLRADIAATRAQVGTRIVEDLQAIADSGDANALVTRLQLLDAKTKQILATSTGAAKDADELSARALGDIIQNTLDQQGGLLRFKGADVSLEQLVSLARNKSIQKALGDSMGSQEKEIFNGIMKFLKTYGGVTDETDVLGKEFLDEKLGYTLGKNLALKETGELGSVPRLFGNTPEEAIDALVPINDGTIRVATPRTRIQIIPEQMNLNIPGMGASNLVDVDANLIEDLAAISVEDLEEVENVIKAGFQERVQAARRASLEVELNPEELNKLSTQYINKLRRMKSLQRANYQVASSRFALDEVKIPTGVGTTVVDPALSESVTTSFIDELDASSGLIDDAAGAVEDSVTGPITSLEDLMRGVLGDITEAESAALDAASSGPRATGKFTPMGEMFKRYMRGAGSKASATLSANKGKFIAGAAAAGLAVIAMKSRKDTTPESISGPPLLPGGNPYESLAGANTQLPDFSPSAKGQGTSYNISFNASQEEIDEFMARAGSLSNGQIQGTMHDTLPDLGSNSYDDIAGSF